MVNAIGMSFSMHYCGGTFKQVCFTADTEKNCCGEGERSGCCHNQVVSAKIKDAHSPADLSFSLKSVYESIEVKPYALIIQTAIPEKGTYYIAHGPSPPLLHKIPIYLLVRNLRI